MILVFVFFIWLVFFLVVPSTFPCFSPFYFMFDFQIVHKQACSLILVSDYQNFHFYVDFFSPFFIFFSLCVLSFLTFNAIKVEMMTSWQKHEIRKTLSI